jgi:hypothetical protein
MHSRGAPPPTHCTRPPFHVGVALLCLPLTSLKYLDQWLDNLSPAFLMPLLANGPGQVLQPLLGCLYSLIKPQPFANGQEAFRILGKLGGMNREFQHVVSAGKQPRYRNHLDSAVVVKLSWSPESSSGTDGASGTGAGTGAGVGAGAGDSQAPGSFEKRVEKFMQWAGAKRVRLGAGGSPSSSSETGTTTSTGSQGTIVLSGLILMLPDTFSLPFRARVDTVLLPPFGFPPPSPLCWWYFRGRRHPGSPVP